MSEPSLIIEDSARFARDGDCVEGEVDGARLRRVLPHLERSGDRLAFRAQGAIESGKLIVTLTVSGEIVLRCQRCLSEMCFPLRIRSRLQLVEPGGDWPDEELADDSLDAIEAARQLDLVALIEDEVLLALPISPRHEACETPVYRNPTESQSPFASLARRMRH